jgi:hypothetical protein
MANKTSFIVYKFLKIIKVLAQKYKIKKIKDSKRREYVWVKLKFEKIKD